MLATRLTKQEARSIRRTHSAFVPAYLMRDDGSVIRIWPSGEIEQIDTQGCRRAHRDPPSQKHNFPCFEGTR